MNVLFVSHVSNKLGAARSLLDLLVGLKAKNVTPYVVLPGSGPIEAELERHTIPYRIIPMRSWASRRRSVIKWLGRNALNIFAAFRLKRCIRVWGIDIVYTNSSVVPSGAFAALLAHKPHIWHIREFGEEDYGLSFDWGARRTRLTVHRLSNRIVLISHALATKYRRLVPSSKFRVIYDAVHLPGHISTQSAPIGKRGEGSLKMAIVGLIHPGKGQMDAILAVAELVRQGRDVTLDVVGDGQRAYLSQLKEAVDLYELNDRVIFTGYIDNPYMNMMKNDVILVCSRSEALGRVTIEANLLARPVIGARSGATAELVKDGFNGLLYEPGDHHDLARQIADLMDGKFEISKMGKNGKEWAQRQFSIERCSDEVYQALSEVYSSVYS
ncbi:MAG: glycosyltransferase family 4 protein [Salinibacter sp.]